MIDFHELFPCLARRSRDLLSFFVGGMRHCIRRRGAAFLPSANLRRDSTDTPLDEVACPNRQKAKKINPLSLQAYVLLEALVRTRHEVLAGALVHAAAIRKSVFTAREEQ